jgi:hypothetical protein
VTNPLDSVLTELEQLGKTNDASTTERPRLMLNITRDTGAFLAVLVKATLARRVLEIGTSNGYSTLWLASAARSIGGSVTTVEVAEYKIRLASANFTRAGLARYISVIHDDAACVLEARLTAHSISSSLIPSGRSIRDGGPNSSACCGLAACWWSITRRLIRSRWRRSWHWSMQMLSSPRVSSRSVMVSSSPYEALSES